MTTLCIRRIKKKLILYSLLISFNYIYACKRKEGQSEYGLLWVKCVILQISFRLTATTCKRWSHIRHTVCFSPFFYEKSSFWFEIITFFYDTQNSWWKKRKANISKIHMRKKEMSKTNSMFIIYTHAFQCDAKLKAKVLPQNATNARLAFNCYYIFRQLLFY